MRLVLQELRRRVKQPWKPQQRSDLDKRDPRLPQMCSNAISNVQCHSGSACLPRSGNYVKAPPVQFQSISSGMKKCCWRPQSRSNPEWVAAVATLLGDRVRIRMNGCAGTTHHRTNIVPSIGRFREASPLLVDFGVLPPTTVSGFDHPGTSRIRPKTSRICARGGRTDIAEAVLDAACGYSSDVLALGRGAAIESVGGIGADLDLRGEAAHL